MEEKKEEKVVGNFSFALGLLDYVNPICFIIIYVNVFKHLRPMMNTVQFAVLLAAVCVSVVFGLGIPTVKCLVGLGKIKFKLPVSFVLCVNISAMVIGLTLLSIIAGLGLGKLALIFAAIVLILVLVYKLTKKINNVALLVGGMGYILIYTSFLILSLRYGLKLPIFCFAFCLLDNATLITLAMTKNLLNAKLHWVIESSNIVSLLVLLTGILTVFKGM